MRGQTINIAFIIFIAFVALFVIIYFLKLGGERLESWLGFKPSTPQFKPLQLSELDVSGQDKSECREKINNAILPQRSTDANNFFRVCNIPQEKYEWIIDLGECGIKTNELVKYIGDNCRRGFREDKGYTSDLTFNNCGSRYNDDFLFNCGVEGTTDFCNGKIKVFKDDEDLWGALDDPGICIADEGTYAVGSKSAELDEVYKVVNQNSKIACEKRENQQFSVQLKVDINAEDIARVIQQTVKEVCNEEPSIEDRDSTMLHNNFCDNGNIRGIEWNCGSDNKCSGELRIKHIVKWGMTDNIGFCDADAK